MVIETKVISGKKYTREDKKMLNLLFTNYLNESPLKYPRKEFIDNFWHESERKKAVAIMAVDKKAGKPLGFITLDIVSKAGKKQPWIAEHYTIPDMRRHGLATKLGKKAFIFSKMASMGSLRTGGAITAAGKELQRSRKEKMRDWEGMHADRFRKTRKK